MEYILKEFSSEIKEIENKLINLAFLETIKLEIGVFDEDVNMKAVFTTINLDTNENEEIETTVGNVMYLINNGSINIPAKNILNFLINDINNKMNDVLNDIYNGIFNNNWNQSNIIDRLNQFVNIINSSIIPNVISKYINNTSYLADLLDLKEEDYTKINLNNIKKYIKCKLIY